MARLLGCGIGHQTLVCGHLRGRATLLGHSEVGSHQFESQFVQGHPGFAVKLGIVERDRQLQRVVVDAMETFFHAQRVAVRTAGIIHPSFCSSIPIVCTTSVVLSTHLAVE